MIDLDEYEEAIIFKQELECGGVIAVGRDDLLHVIDRLRQAEKDAERYRWLRDLPDGSAHEEIGNYPGDMWDESIDEAMQCNK